MLRIACLAAGLFGVACGNAGPRAPAQSAPEPPPPPLTDASATALSLPVCEEPDRWQDVLPATDRRVLTLVTALDWDAYTWGPPEDCQLRVAARCAPDLDGDGARDALVRLSWVVRVDEATEQSCAALDPDAQLWPGEAVVVLSGDRVIGVVSYAVSDGQNDIRHPVLGFERTADGRIGIVGATRRFDSARGCDVHHRWVRVIEDGKLVERERARDDGCATE